MFKVLKNGTKPTKGSKYSAAIDLYSSEDVIMYAGSTALIGLGVCIDLEQLTENLAQIRNTRRRMKKGNSKATEQSLVEIKKSALNKFKKAHYIQLEPRSSLRAKGLQSVQELWI